MNNDDLIKYRDALDRFIKEATESDAESKGEKLLAYNGKLDTTIANSTKDVDMFLDRLTAKKVVTESTTAKEFNTIYKEFIEFLKNDVKPSSMSITKDDKGRPVELDIKGTKLDLKDVDKHHTINLERFKVMIDFKNKKIAVSLQMSKDDLSKINMTEYPSLSTFNQNGKAYYVIDSEVSLLNNPLYSIW